jgi:uncharacterized protein (TIGR03437 family)
MSFSVTVSQSIRSSGKSLYFTDLSANLRRFVVAGLNRNPIPEGTLVNLIVNLEVAASNGSYPLALSNIRFSDPDGEPVPATGTDGTVTVQGAGGLRMEPWGVLNAGSLLPGPIAPGEILTLMGSAIGPGAPQIPDSGPTSAELGGTGAVFDQTPGRLLYAAPNQINVIVPFGIAPQSTARLRITRANQIVAELPLLVAAAAPAIFTLDSSGVGPGAILNQDASVNSPSNPAVRGSIGVLYATGAGQTDPASVDGQISAEPLPKPVLPISVRIGGLAAEVTYAGAAPGFVAGLLQVNFRIPPNAATGYTVPVQLVVGTASSPAGVTLAIR